VLLLFRVQISSLPSDSYAALLLLSSCWPSLMHPPLHLVTVQWEQEVSEPAHYWKLERLYVAGLGAASCTTCTAPLTFSTLQDRAKLMQTYETHVFVKCSSGSHYLPISCLHHFTTFNVWSVKRPAAFQVLQGCSQCDAQNWCSKSMVINVIRCLHSHMLEVGWCCIYSFALVEQVLKSNRCQ
jgi:hypothetical protein